MSAFGGFGSTQSQQQQQQQGTTGGLFGGGFGTSNTAPATGGSLFGNTAQSATNTGGGLFGSANTNTQAGGTSGGLFGSSAQQPSGGLFGNANANTGQQSGGLFGSTQQSGANAAPSGGLFGSAQTGQTGGGLFGNTNAGTSTGTTGGGLFGNAAGNTNTTGGGLFGNTGASTNTGGGLFGNASTNTQSAPSGSLFGNNTSNTTGGGLFGGTTNTTGTSGGLFGSTTTAPSGGLFGSTTNNAPSAGGGLFGSTTGAANTGNTGGLFGSNATGTTGGLFGSTQQGASGQSSLFGNTNQAPGSSLFGNNQQQQQQNQTGSLFGNLNQPQKPAGFFGSTLGTSTLGASTIGGSTLLGSTNNLFASKPAIAPNPQQDAQSQFAQLTQRIEGIAQAWDPNSPQCRFQHHFYNLVDPNQVHLYGRPPNAFNDALWQKAVRENPDPSCFVPVIATGFDDLQKRVEAQTQQAAAHQEKLKELQQRIAALTQRHQLSNASRLHRASALQTQLTHRVIKLVQHLHLLIPALRSSALRPEEEALRTALEEIDEEVRRPGGTGRIRGKLNELWALVGAVTAARERDRKAGGVEWAVVDEEGLAQITQILAEEQAGLAHLTKLLQKDMKDLAIIQGSSPQDEDPDLMSSTATLRASTL
ncbi:nucleoporin complex subunit 54-domain-containing protein [Cubamyces menziesii]|nr:nucleoporin complex subunit 54-domain-containing protein [Cubamyces menziesii]